MKEIRISKHQGRGKENDGKVMKQTVPQARSRTIANVNARTGNRGAPSDKKISPLAGTENSAKQAAPVKDEEVEEDSVAKIIREARSSSQRRPYMIQRTESSEAIAWKSSLELKRKYLTEQTAPYAPSKSQSTTDLDSRVKTFMSRISETQRLLGAKPAAAPAVRPTAPVRTTLGGSPLGAPGLSAFSRLRTTMSVDASSSSKPGLERTLSSPSTEPEVAAPVPAAPVSSPLKKRGESIPPSESPIEANTTPATKDQKMDVYEDEPPVLVPAVAVVTPVKASDAERTKTESSNDEPPDSNPPFLPVETAEVHSSTRTEESPECPPAQTSITKTSSAKSPLAKPSSQQASPYQSPEHTPAAVAVQNSLDVDIEESLTDISAVDSVSGEAKAAAAAAIAEISAAIDAEVSSGVSSGVTECLDSRKTNFDVKEGAMDENDMGELSPEALAQAVNPLITSQSQPTSLDDTRRVFDALVSDLDVTHVEDKFNGIFEQPSSITGASIALSSRPPGESSTDDPVPAISNSSVKESLAESTALPKSVDTQVAHQLGESKVDIQPVDIQIAAEPVDACMPLELVDMDALNESKPQDSGQDSKVFDEASVGEAKEKHPVVQDSKVFDSVSAGEAKEKQPVNATDVMNSEPKCTSAAGTNGIITELSVGHTTTAKAAIDVSRLLEENRALLSQIRQRHSSGEVASAPVATPLPVTAPTESASAKAATLSTPVTAPPNPLLTGASVPETAEVETGCESIESPVESVARDATELDLSDWAHESEVGSVGGELRIDDRFITIGRGAAAATERANLATLSDFEDVPDLPEDSPPASDEPPTPTQKLDDLDYADNSGDDDSPAISSGGKLLRNRGHCEYVYPEDVASRLDTNASKPITAISGQKARSKDTRMDKITKKVAAGNSQGSSVNYTDKLTGVKKLGPARASRPMESSSESTTKSLGKAPLEKRRSAAEALAESKSKYIKSASDPKRALGNKTVSSSAASSNTGERKDSGKASADLAQSKPTEDNASVSKPTKDSAVTGKVISSKNRASVSSKTTSDRTSNVSSGRPSAAVTMRNSSQVHSRNAATTVNRNSAPALSRPLSSGSKRPTGIPSTVSGPAVSTAAASIRSNAPAPNRRTAAQNAATLGTRSATSAGISRNQPTGGRRPLSAGPAHQSLKTSDKGTASQQAGIKVSPIVEQASARLLHLQRSPTDSAIVLNQAAGGRAPAQGSLVRDLVLSRVKSPERAVRKRPAVLPSSSRPPPPPPDSAPPAATPPTPRRAALSAVSAALPPGPPPPKPPRDPTALSLFSPVEESSSAASPVRPGPLRGALSRSTPSVLERDLAASAAASAAPASPNLSSSSNLSSRSPERPGPEGRSDPGSVGQEMNKRPERRRSIIQAISDIFKSGEKKAERASSPPPERVMTSSPTPPRSPFVKANSVRHKLAARLSKSKERKWSEPSVPSSRGGDASVPASARLDTSAASAASAASPDSSLSEVAPSQYSETVSPQGTLSRRSKTSRAARHAEMRRLQRAQELQRQLDEVEVRQRDLELRGVDVEKALRGEPHADSGGDDEAALLHEWFDLVHERSLLVRRDQLLQLQLRELQMEDRHDRLQLELRERMATRDSQKTAADIEREREVVTALLELAEQRRALRLAMDAEQQRLRAECEAGDTRGASASASAAVVPPVGTAAPAESTV